MNLGKSVVTLSNSNLVDGIILFLPWYKREELNDWIGKELWQDVNSAINLDEIETII